MPFSVLLPSLWSNLSTAQWALHKCLGVASLRRSPREALGRSPEVHLSTFPVERVEAGQRPGELPSPDRVKAHRADVLLLTLVRCQHRVPPGLLDNRMLLMSNVGVGPDHLSVNLHHSVNLRHGQRLARGSTRDPLAVDVNITVDDRGGYTTPVSGPVAVDVDVAAERGAAGAPGVPDAHGQGPAVRDLLRVDAVVVDPHLLVELPEVALDVHLQEGSRLLQALSLLPHQAVNVSGA
mmetsp:Transcript_32087/g.92201  ORF Transcript_32087/g.92201 Transcript_32087/m.92201 type:complete len:237 (-) Transcript_32087:88-798(-)